MKKTKKTKSNLKIILKKIKKLKKVFFKKARAFTLVELIVVVTILAILATIGFVSYSSYLVWVRDTNRLAQLVSIHDWLTLYSTQKDLPIPDENIEVKVEVSSIEYAIWYQWYAGSNTLESIDFTKGGQDPRDGTFFSYMLTDDRKNFQLMAFLEEEQNIQSSFFQGVNAVDLSSRVATVYGDRLWILTDDKNLPIQDVPDLKNSGEILLDGTGDNYIAHNTDTDFITWNGSQLLYWAYVEIVWKSQKSCKNILSKFPYIAWTDGQYWLDVDSQSIKIDCDMTTEGWWWTIVAHANDSDMEKYDSRGNWNWSNGNSFINYSSAEETFKFSDATINSVRSGWDYMLQWSNTSNAWAVTTYFTPWTCVYDHDTIVSGACESMFNDIAFSNTSWISTTDSTNSGKGIAVWGNGIIMNFSVSSAACFQHVSGWCTWSTQNASIKLFVR